MSLFTVAPTSEIIGHSTWPFDSLYMPVVGLFIAGVLQQSAVCRHMLDEIVVPRLRLRTRVKRRLLREVGRPVPSVIVMPNLTGPATPVWFRLPIAPDLSQRVRDGDLQVKLERLEDAEPILPMRPTPVTTPHGPFATPVEALLNAPTGSSHARLDGFAHFLSAPPRYQLEATFVEYLGRMPEKTAREAYLPQLEQGNISVFDLRAFILASDEFKGRMTRLGSRVGSGLTSNLWSHLAASPTIAEPHRMLPSAAPEASDSLEGNAYCEALSVHILGRRPTVAEGARHRELIDCLGRSEGTKQVARWGAREGRFFRVD